MRYVSIAYRGAVRGRVAVDIKDGYGQTVATATHTDGAGQVVLPSGITPAEADELVGQIVGFRRRERAAYKADLGTPDDGPVWTVIGGYDDDEGESIFHIHAQDVEDLSVKIHQAKILYDWVVAQDTPTAALRVAEIIPSHFRTIAIFEGALVSKV